jgi:hypothetical protein
MSLSQIKSSSLLGTLACFQVIGGALQRLISGRNADRPLRPYGTADTIRTGRSLMLL